MRHFWWFSRHCDYEMMLTWPLQKRNWTEALYILHWSPSILWMSSSKVSLSIWKNAYLLFIKLLNRCSAFVSFFQGWPRFGCIIRRFWSDHNKEANNSSIKAFNLFSHTSFMDRPIKGSSSFQNIMEAIDLIWLFVPIYAIGGPDSWPYW